MPDLRSLSVVVTCMGRLSFLRRTLPRAVKELPGRYYLVDYGCPEQSGAWVEREYREHVESGRIVVQGVTGVTEFHKTDALNQGARRAIDDGAKYLCFLDADTLVQDGFWRHIEERWNPATFLIPALDSARSVFGVLVANAADFARLSGYDETFRGWGNEDLEMRLRLHLQGGLDYDFIPASLLGSIPHEDELRTQNYSEKDKNASFSRSWSYTIDKVRSWTGRAFYDLGPVVLDLMRPLTADDGAPDETVARNPPPDGREATVSAAKSPPKRRGWGKRWGQR
jgi:hypothetical protein